MFVTGPHAGLDGHGGPTHIIRATRRAFSGPAQFLLDAGHRASVREYLSDMIRPYDRTLTDGFGAAEFSGDLGHSYGEMAEALLAATVQETEPVDLLVLAFAIHDMRPGRATATYLSHACPGRPLAFAVCDQGMAAAFTGLRLAREYLGGTACRRALLLVVEQATLPYPPASNGSWPAPLPARHAGVALLFAEEAAVGSAGSAGLRSVRQHADVAPERVAELVASEVTELSAGASPTVVLGGAVAQIWPGRPGDDVRVAAAGQPYTGVWWELAGILSEPGRSEPGRSELGRSLPGPGRARRLVLAEYDPALRYLCLCAVDRG